MAIALDLAVILIFALSVFLAYRRGFLEAIIKLLGSIGAVLLALFLSRVIAPFVFNTAIRPGIVSDLTDKLSGAAVGVGWEAAVDQICNILPDFLGNMLFHGESVSEGIRGILIPGGDIASMAGQVADQYIGPAVILLLEILLFVLLFFVCRLVLRLVIKVFRGVRYIPVIGSINRLLGSLVGVFQAVIYILLLGMAANIVILLTGDGLPYFNLEIIRSTKLFLVFYYFNPLVIF